MAHVPCSLIHATTMTKEASRPAAGDLESGNDRVKERVVAACPTNSSHHMRSPRLVHEKSGRVRKGGYPVQFREGGLAVGPKNRAVSVPLLRAAGRQARVRMLMTRRGGEAALAERAEQR